jgi:teichuronic acid biosynthesis glycosyltransferase TuaG
MTTNPVVSIVIPTFNCAPLLSRALISVRAQTFISWEAIVVNNFSEDNTIEVVNSFNDPRFRLINFANQGVIAASRNLGAREARASYIAFLDADDVWLTDKLKRCLEVMQTGVDVVCHRERFVRDGIPTRQVTAGGMRTANFKELLLRGNCLSPSAVIMRREVFERSGGFSEAPEVITAEDYDLWLRIAAMRATITLMPEILGEYHLHGSNSTKSVMRHRDAVQRVLENHFHDGKTWSPIDRLRYLRRCAIVEHSAGVSLIEQGKFGAGVRLLWSGIRSFPILLRSFPWLLYGIFQGSFRRDCQQAQS